MSHAASSYVIRRRFGNPTRKLLMMLLADHANAAHEAWPAVETLAARAECSARSVQSHLQALVKDGDLLIRPNSGPNGVNVYRILFRKFGPGEMDETGVQNLRGGVQNSARDLRGGGCKSAPVIFTQICKEPSLEPSRGEEERAEPAPRKQIPPSPPVQIIENLKSCYPHAPTSIVGRELDLLTLALPILAELTPDDWQAIRAWNFCPKRIRGRTLWPRDRFEFLSHASEAIESVRRWWTAGGRDWQPQRRSQPPPPASQPIDPIDPQDVRAFFKKPPIATP